MLTEERRLAIVELAQKDGRVDVVNAAGKFSVAVETIRRDLDVLQRRGLMRRVHGGAIALGHPLGASGTKLMATLLNALEARGGKYGLQTMCEGGGQANVTIIERV